MNHAQSTHSSNTSACNTTYTPTALEVRFIHIGKTSTASQNPNINLLLWSLDRHIDQATHLVLYDVQLEQRFANVEVGLCVLLLSAEEAVESEEVTTKITRMLNVTFLHADINKKENFIEPNVILLTKAASQVVLQHEIIWVCLGEFFMI